jgi:hypothetical protein
VTKADLWWNQDTWPNVLDHYASGDYYKALGAAASLQQIVLPYSSVFHKFYGKGSLSGQFDDGEKLSFRVNLFRNMLALIGKGTSNGRKKSPK